MSKFKKLSFKNVKTYSLKNRKSKVSLNNFAKKLENNPSFTEFLDSIPDILTGLDFKKFIRAYLQAIKNQSQVIMMMGAHVIKVGLSPVLIDVLKQGWITHLAMNGACAIHDVELALCGKTSEDVANGLGDGSFGMVKETNDLINAALSKGSGKFGAAEAVAKAIHDSSALYKEYSILYTAYKLEIPITVHSAIGTEITHQHPNVNGAAIGETGWWDFQILANSMSKLDKKSIVMNIGSAVIMPEVFLKALTVVRNLGYKAAGFTTATFDMIRHYRPSVNVVERPTHKSGQGFYFIGHHELMIPLLFAALKS